MSVKLLKNSFRASEENGYLFLTGKNYLKKNLLVLRVGQVEEIEHLEE